MGFNLNAAGECEAALTYLLPIYKSKPNYPGLEFELAYAYNDLGQTDMAINVLNTAVSREPNNPRFYRELGYAYMKKGDKQQAISYFKKGIDQSNDKADKGEMAYNMAMVYRSLNDQDNFKEWAIKAKGWADPNSPVYKSVVQFGL